MTRERRPQMTASEMAILWERWKRGETVSAISRALDRPGGVIHGIVARRGGIAPVPRRRAARALTLAEREEISRGVAAAHSCRAIGRALGRPASTVSRELSRHGGRLRYRAATADRRTWDRGRRPKRCRLATHARLRAAVSTKLQGYWSPEQIATWLRRTFPDNPAMQVSHETIYRTLFVQSRGALKQALIGHLRRRRRMRRAKRAVKSARQQILDPVSIRERPAEAEDRAVPGHWEGDLLAGAAHSHIATLVERRSRYVMLVRLECKETEYVVGALARTVRTLPRDLMRTLTWDRGTELAAHKTFTVATNVQVYFCDPHSPWQRGSNENTNGLLRQYFPHGTNVATFSQRQLNAVARQLNTRPRKTLGWDTPAVRLAATVASTP